MSYSFIDPLTGQLINNGTKEANVSASTSGLSGSFTTSNNGITNAFYANANKDSGVGYSKKNNQSQFVANSIMDLEGRNPLRISNDDDVRNYIGNIRLSNTESGGLLKNNQTNSISYNAGLSYSNRVGGQFVVTNGTTEGDALNNSIWSRSLGVGAGTGGVGLIAGLVKTNINATTSDRGSGTEFGARVNGILPELVASYVFISNGVKRTIPVGGILSNIATGNIVGLANNVMTLFRGEKLDIPRHEIIYPDDKPQLSPKTALFNPKTTELTLQGKQAIEDIYNEYQKNPNTKLELGQYQDEKGFLKGIFANKAEMEKLSQERQEIIKNSLIAKGIPEELIKIGHTDVNANDKHITIEDHNTNVRYIADGKIELTNGARFNSERSSPAGEEKINQIRNSEEFKALTKGQSKIEIEYASELIFNKVYLSDNPKTIADAMKDIGQFYQEGKSLSKSLTTLSDEDVLKSISNNSQFKEYVEKNSINVNEQKELAKYVLKITDDASKENSSYLPNTLEGALGKYNNDFLNKGISLSELSKIKDQFQTQLEKNPIYIEAIKNKNKHEELALGSYAFSEFINGNKKDISSSIQNTLEAVNQNIYQQGKTMSMHFYQQSGGSNTENGFYKDKMAEIKQADKNFKDLFNGDEFKTVMTSHSNIKKSDEIELFKNTITQLALQHPNERVENIIKSIEKEVYGNGLTITQYLKNPNGQTNEVQTPTNNVNPTSTSNVPTLVNTDVIKQEEIENQKRLVQQEQEIKNATGGFVPA